MKIKNLVVWGAMSARKYFIKRYKQHLQKGRDHFVQPLDLELFPEHRLQIISIDDLEAFLAATIHANINLADLVTGDSKLQNVNQVHPLLEKQFELYLGGTQLYTDS